MNGGDLFWTNGQLSRVAGELSRTAVNGSVFHGMQEVRSSNLLSSTSQKAKFEQLEHQVQQQSTATDAAANTAHMFESARVDFSGCLPVRSKLVARDSLGALTS